MLRFILPILLLHSLNVAAQKQNNNWCFGGNSGLAFNTNPPSSFATSMLSKEGCATMSNRHTGDLMFYTNGIDIWDAMNNVMPNGQDLGNIRGHDGTSIQGVVIVPFVNDTNKYYLFTLSTQPLSTLRYSIVDMTLNGGLGDIVGGQKAIAIDSGFAEGMTVVPTCNGYWIIVIKDLTTDFYAYRVTKHGVETRSVISKFNYDKLAVRLLGPLRPSPNGEKIALVAVYNIFQGSKYRSFVSIQDFDNSTGILSNGKVIDTGENRTFYSAEFSPNSKYLYVTTTNNSSDSARLFQYDISLTAASLINASRKTCATATLYFRTLQSGPDNNIYLIEAPNFLGAITNSNLPYPNCTYIPQAISIDSGRLLSGLPQKVVYNDTPTSLTTRRLDTALCVSGGYSLDANTKYKLHLWQDGSTLKSFDIKKPGIFWVWMADTDTGCLSYVDTFVVKDRKDTTNSRMDTTICFNTPLTVTANNKSPDATYEWSTQDNDKQISVSKEGLVWVRITEPCRIAMDSTIINFKGIPVRLNGDTTICIGDTLLLVNSYMPQGAVYSWSTGSKDSIIKATDNGIYQLNISYEGCSDSDVIIVTQYPALQIDLGTDAELCNGDELVLANLSRSHEDVKYLWQDGATTEEYHITKPGQYFLTINNVCDTLTDTVKVTERNCRFFFPSAFTPNGDGKNDIARLAGDIEVITHYQLRIFNRWGEEVFFTDNVNKGWDGFYNGVSAEMGTYFYQIQYTYQAERELMKGNLLLIH